MKYYTQNYKTVLISMEDIHKILQRKVLFTENIISWLKSIQHPSDVGLLLCYSTMYCTLLIQRAEDPGIGKFLCCHNNIIVESDL